MKYIILSISLVLLTLTSFCQTATKTASTQIDLDSIIPIPKKIALYMIQDILKGDVAKKIVNQQDSLILEKNKEISFKDSTTYVYKEKYDTCEVTNQKWQLRDSLNKDTIKNLNGTLKKVRLEKNIYKTSTFTIIGLTLIRILILK